MIRPIATAVYPKISTIICGKKISEIAHTNRSMYRHTVIAYAILIMIPVNRSKDNSSPTAKNCILILTTTLDQRNEQN